MWRKILLPVSWIYASIIFLRNKCYDLGWFRSEAYDFPVICIGNLRVGGTGKTPMTEYVARLIKEEVNLALLSRGYKRRSKGYVLGVPGMGPEDLGDEPFQFFRKFPEVTLAVDANRQRGIYNLRKEGAEVVLLDDAFQHRKIRAGLNILLTVYGDLYTRDTLLPAGNLRDAKDQAARADIIVVTKCPPALSEQEMQAVRSELQPLPGQEVYFATIDYDQYVYNENGKKLELGDLPERLTLLTGIASPGHLKDHLKQAGVEFEHRDFPDHHNFTDKELSRLSNASFILTTEKDFVRLNGKLQDLWYLPIRIRILEADGKFESQLKSFIAGS